MAESNDIIQQHPQPQEDALPPPPQVDVPPPQEYGPPPLEDAPAQQQIALSVPPQEDAPPPEEDAPPLEEDAPPRQQDALSAPPPQEDDPPPEEDASLPQEDATPPEVGAPPPQEDGPPPPQGDAPSPQEDGPPPLEDAPSQQQIALSVRPQEDAPPLEEDAPPPEEDAPPRQQDVLSAQLPHEDAPLPEEDAPLPQEDATPPEEGAPPPQEDGPPPPQVDAPPPQEDGPLPQDDARPLPHQNSQPPQDEPQRPRHPNQDLLNNDRRRDFIDICVPLYNALTIGNWDAAQLSLNGRPYLLRSSITGNLETPLHVVASAQSNTKSIDFVKKLVDKMDPEDLLLQNRNGNTALSLAAISGNVKFAEIMVMGNRELCTIPNGNELMPLYIAVLFRNLEIVEFLYKESQQMCGRGWTPKNRSWVFVKAVEAEFFDFALQILRDHLPLAQSIGALSALARRPCAFNEIKPNFFWRIVSSILCCKVESVAMDSKAMKLLRKIWTHIEEKSKDEIDRILRGPMVLIKERQGDLVKERQTYPSRILFVAAEMGNIKFLAELIRRYPDLIWKTNDDGLSIFHVAVSNLHESIYNLLYEIGSMKGLIVILRDKEQNNMLHLVGKKPEKSQLQDVSGVAFQMQRKLLWFKEVESMIPPHYKEQKNNSGLTPYQLFTENHKVLVSEGEKWMKATASNCIVVAALIATVVFAVAYTIPGGYQQNDDQKNNLKDGFPVFLHKPPFLVFVVLDAISLILSSTSILVFLAILTSRYAQEDFIESLPKKLFVGLLMLFLSVVSMMLSFSVSFFLIYRGNFIAIAIFVSVCALVPMASYAKLQYPLLKDVYHSTYGSRCLFKPKKQMLYHQNPTV